MGWKLLGLFQSREHVIVLNQHHQSSVDWGIWDEDGFERGITCTSRIVGIEDGARIDSGNERLQSGLESNPRTKHFMVTITNE